MNLIYLLNDKVVGFVWTGISNPCLFGIYSNGLIAMIHWFTNKKLNSFKEKIILSNFKEKEGGIGTFR